MKALKAWVDALNINHVEYQSWCDEVPASVSLTFWCLLKHKIQPDSYLDWAKNHYGLATLTEEYFEQEANRQFWNQIQSVANWSPSLLPLTEWDGVVFVGCVEPPEDVQWSFPVQYVLAPAEGLEKFWNELQAEAATPTPQREPTISQPTPAQNAAPVTTQATSAVTSSMPAPSSTDSPTAPPVGQPITLSEDLPTPPSQPAPYKEPAEAMEGLNLNLESAGAGDNNGMPEGINLDLAPMKLEIPDEAPKQEPQLEGLNLAVDLNAPALPTEALATEAPEPVAAPVNTSAATAMPQSETRPQQPPVAETETVSAEASAPVAETFEPSITSSEVTSLNRHMPRHDSPVDAVIDTKKAPKDLTEAKDENEIVAWAFHKLKEHFKRSMILLLEGDTLRAWKWEKSWAPRTPTTFEGFDTTRPSVFRIVKRSKLPYHGHVVPSEANQEFFLNWGFANLPEHVTALPLCIDDEPIGILISVGESSSNTQQALSFADRVAVRLTETLSRVHSQAA